jgi:hypothetical protein
MGRTLTTHRRKRRPCPRAVLAATLQRRRRLLEGVDSPEARAELGIVLLMLDEVF